MYTEAILFSRCTFMYVCVCETHSFPTRKLFSLLSLVHLQRYVYQTEPRAHALQIQILIPSFVLRIPI